MLSGSTTCTGVSGVSASMACSVSGNMLTITNIVDSATTAALSLTISDLRYSLTTGGTTGIQATSKTADGLYDIDATSTLALTGVDTPATLTLVGTGISVASSSIVTEAGAATFRFRVPVPVAQSCKFRIVFPLDMSVDSTSTTVDVNYISFPRPQTGQYSAPKSSG